MIGVALTRWILGQAVLQPDTLVIKSASLLVMLMAIRFLSKYTNDHSLIHSIYIHTYIQTFICIYTCRISMD